MAHEQNINSYLFVFFKSTEKTDIQKGELLALIEMQHNNVIIESSEIENLEGENDLKFTNNSIIDKNRDKILVIFLSQSAIVYTSVRLDIKEIIRRSGYIHSCGKFIFLSKWDNLKIKEITNDITAFFKKEQQEYKVLFYKESDNPIKNKLEGLLIDDKRYHIENYHFNTAQQKIEMSLENNIKKHGKGFKSGNEKIFIIKEKGIDNSSPSVLSNLYNDRNIIDFAIGYLSEYKKDNPIHELDEVKEMKPFWSGIFTTPHRLMNAMINLAKLDETSTVLDPFCRTGTISIEASQIGCKSISSDIFGSQGAKDNYDFLCSGYKFFKNTVEKIDNQIDNNELNEELQNKIGDGIKDNNRQGLPVADNDVAFKIENFSKRLHFYILRRYEMENRRGSSFIKQQNRKSRDKNDNGKNLPNEVDFIKSYIKNSKNTFDYTLCGKQLKLFEEQYRKTNEPVLNLDVDTSGCFTDGNYLTKRVGYINKSAENNIYPVFKINDICDKKDFYNIAESTIDAVVTDPPYGYGEGIDKEKVEEIYKSLVEKSFYWLKPFGYLIICALDKVKTGRKENLLFTENILEIINDIAKKENVEFLINDVLSTNKHLKNIYYWKSKYALNRSIIALQIIKKNKQL
ncbi:MAG: hypothetical protein K9I68_00270 [Bacteroidales bacterium]|nr:hypothetical protein [Bacteroidales bacterium]MCF8336413.1 hypothetical protein [Bacteroidales bacterium]